MPSGHVVVPAPSLGTFYRAPKPGAPSFIEIGQAVVPESELCLVEVMKLFTTLRAGVSGIVRQILVSDGDMIETGQPLFVVEPNG
jgi:acetyl-CoA carboxylase biotin carboxyl carrier protein